MQSNQIIIINGTLRVIGAFLLILIPDRKRAWIYKNNSRKTRRRTHQGCRLVRTTTKYCGYYTVKLVRFLLGFSIKSRRAHLLTTAKTRRVLVSGGISTFVETVRSPRVAAPLEPCGSCHRDVTFRAVAFMTTALSTLYRSLDSVGIAVAIPNFFLKKETKTITRKD